MDPVLIFFHNSMKGNLVLSVSCIRGIDAGLNRSSLAPPPSELLSLLSCVPALPRHRCWQIKENRVRNYVLADVGGVTEVILGTGESTDGKGDDGGRIEALINETTRGFG